MHCCVQLNSTCQSIIADHHKTVLLLKSKSGHTNQNDDDFLRRKSRDVCLFKSNSNGNSSKYSLFLGYLLKVFKVPSLCSNTLKGIKVSS